MTDENNLEDDADRPFTKAERKALREIIDADRKAKWLRATIRLWLAGIAAFIAFILSIKDYLRGAIKGMVGG